MCCCSLLKRKLFIGFFIGLACVLAILVSFFHDNAINIAMFVSRFFQVMLPILAVGALIKYILVGGKCCCDDSCNCGCNTKVNKEQK